MCDIIILVIVLLELGGFNLKVVGNELRDRVSTPELSLGVP